MNRLRQLISSSPLRRAGWTVADQALSSVTNFALFFLVARSVNDSELGAFSAAFSAYLIANGVVRAVASEPLAVRYSAEPAQQRRRAARDSTGLAIVVGLAEAAILAGIGLAVGGLIGSALLAVAIVVPGLVLQDAWRFVFFAWATPAKAAANDLVWALVQLVGVVWLLLGTTEPTVFDLVLAWGGAATLAGLVGVAQAGVLPRPQHAWVYVQRHRDLGPKFLAEFAVAGAANELTSFTIVAVSDLTTLGSLRAAIVLMGPLNILYMCAGLFAVPEGVRQETAQPGGLQRTAKWYSAALAAMALLWGATLLLVPDDLGRLLLQQNWDNAQPVILPTAIAIAALGFSRGPAWGLRVMARAADSLFVRTIAAPVGMVVKTVGAAVGAAPGAAWSGAAVETGTAALWWRQFQHASRRVPVAERTRV